MLAKLPCLMWLFKETTNLWDWEKIQTSILRYKINVKEMLLRPYARKGYPFATIVKSQRIKIVGVPIAITKDRYYSNLISIYLSSRLES